MGKGVSFRIPILEGHLVLSNGPWLLGGISGQSFMIQSRGTTQPRAGKGVVAPGVTLWPPLPYNNGPCNKGHQIYKTSPSSRDLGIGAKLGSEADFFYVKKNYLYLYLEEWAGTPTCRKKSKPLCHSHTTPIALNLPIGLD